MLYRVIGVISLLSVLGGCGEKAKKSDPTPAEPSEPKNVTINNIATLGSDIYNTNLAGKTCTTVDKSATCSAGGTVKITGSFSCSTSTAGARTTNLDLIYTMTDCIIVRSGVTTTLTGVMKYTGSSTDVASVITNATLNYQSTGSVKIISSGSNYKTLDSSCEFALTSRVAEIGGSSKVNGTFCGDSYSLAQ